MCETTVHAILRAVQNELTFINHNLTCAMALVHAQGLPPYHARRINSAVDSLQSARKHLGVIATRLELLELQTPATKNQTNSLNGGP